MRRRGLAGALRTLVLDGNLLAQRTTAEEVEYTGGLQALAEALEFNASLTHLSLRSNVLGPESLKVLATGLYDNAGEPQLRCDWKSRREGEGYQVTGTVS
jgi:hypothetical protein